MLADHQIRTALQRRLLEIKPFSARCLQPATYDLRVGSLAAVTTADHPLRLDRSRFFSIEPGAMAIVQTLEILKLSSTIAGRIGPKTDLLRRGIFVATGPQVDPGYHGRLIVNMINLSPRPFLVKYRNTFLTVEFQRLSTRPHKLYQGRYQGRTELGQEELHTLLAFHGPALSDIHRGFAQMQGQLQSIANIGAILPSLVERLSTPGGKATSFLVHIESFEPEPYLIRQPLPIFIERSETGVGASFHEANIHAAGDTDQEALDNLRSLVLDIFESLERSRASRLGPEPLRQLAVLRTYIKRKLPS